MRIIIKINFSNFLHSLKRVLTDSDNKNIFLPFIWHGFFLGLTMSMIELNTVLPNLISELTNNKIAFGGIYSIMLGAPLVFNLVFSHYLKKFEFKKRFLLIGIYLRSASFLGMAIVTFFFAKNKPILALILFYILIMIFSTSAGFTGIAYTEIIGKLLPSKKRPILYATRQIFMSLASLIGGFLVAQLFSLKNINFPLNYTLSMLIGSGGLLIGAFGFWTIKEPPLEIKNQSDDNEPIFRGTFKILKEDKSFLKFIITENITSFSLMILPFYMVFVKTTFSDYKNYFGAFIISQISGSIISNFIWTYISKKFGISKVLKACILTGALIPLIAILLKSTGAIWYVFIFFLVGVITSGRNISFEPFLLDITPINKRTIYLGIRGTLNILVVFLPLAGGFFIANFGFEKTFILVSIIMTIAFFTFNNKSTEKSL